ncbi:MAG: hypothetical protein EAZ97_13380 [Bacteroidetes bacterium]|nr:MAG: hypothetical protein EAZ97_13380 [Bacteroidota bacterium]
MTFLVSANTQNQATNLRSKLQNIVCKANKEEIDQAIYCIETVLEKAKNKVSLNFLFAVSLEKDLWAFQFSAKTM